MEPDSETRARRAWPVLVALARRRGDPLTYGELCAKLGLHHRAAAPLLDRIQQFCKRNGLPPIHALVVNARTRLPGSGSIGSGRDVRAHRRALERVYDYREWSARAPTFREA